MSWNQKHYPSVIVCNGCGDHFEWPGKMDHQIIVLRSRGWKCRPGVTGYEDFCATCAPAIRDLRDYAMAPEDAARFPVFAEQDASRRSAQ